MIFKKLSEMFEGAACKYLSAVDAEPSKSNQHEIGGLPAAGFRRYLGTPENGEVSQFSCTYVYITDENTAPVIFTDTASWYDCRYIQTNRSPEYRLYYTENPVTAMINEGDFFLIAKRTNNSILMIFTLHGTTLEQQIRALFGIREVTGRMRAAEMNDVDLILPLRMLLEEIGVEIVVSTPNDERFLEMLLRDFPDGFPATRIFSSKARKTLSEVSCLDDPDGALMLWMEREEYLFRILEKHLVSKRLVEGFGEDGRDVDEFIKFSLSIQNRRKSRMGHALENHLEQVFIDYELRFEKGVGGNYTEGRSKPDFLFPTFASYHNPEYPTASLRMLGAKSTCKDRWRQVLAEADRIDPKHLITLEPGISETQTDEMNAKHLKLVVPEAVHSSYTAGQQCRLLTLKDFIKDVRTI